MPALTPFPSMEASELSALATLRVWHEHQACVTFDARAGPGEGQRCS